MLEFLASPILGSVIGSLSSLWTKREERKQKEADQKHQRQMLILQSKHKIDELTVEGEMRQEVAREKSFTQSQKVLSKFGDGIRMLVRPILTGYLVFIVSWLGFELNGLVGGLEGLDGDSITTMYKDLMLTVEALASMSVAWWFGSRWSGVRKNA